MRRFTDLYLDLDRAAGTNAKVDRLVAYFEEAPPMDAAWAVALLNGQRPRGAASSRVLCDLARELSGVSPWLFDECRAAVGDLSETIALLLPDPGTGASDSLAAVMERDVLPLAGAGEQDRREVLGRALARLDADERFVYLKLVRGGFRLGVQRRLVARALARLASVPVEVMVHRLTGNIETDETGWARLMGAESAADEAARPYPFFLAHQFTGSIDRLGPLSDWLVEWKWDGIRAQLLRRGGEVVLWSRGEEIITHQFPEIVLAASDLPAGTVLDGEVLLWGEAGPRPFAALQTRLNRKVAPTEQMPLFRAERPVFMAFDVMEMEGVDRRGVPLDARRSLLVDLLSSRDDDTILLSPEVAASDGEALAASRGSSRERGVEGLMLKCRRSLYGVGRVKPEVGGGWWKWKVDPFSVDAVLVAAQPGSGRRAGLYTDYTFAVWSGAGAGRELTTFAKAYSGLTHEEIESLDRWIRRHTVTRTGPVRHVEPVHVFEISFEAIRRSPRHRSGVAVRFPRMTRWRRDKQAAEADHLDALLALLEVSPT